MSRNGYLLIVVFALLTTLFAIWNHLNPHFDWQERYQDDNKQPYNTFVITELLKRSYPNQRFEVLPKRIHQALKDSAQTGANYVFVGQAVYADSADIAQWLRFVAQGNTVFLAANILPKKLFEKIDPDDCDTTFRLPLNPWNLLEQNGFYKDSSVYMNFNHPQLLENKAIAYKYVIENKSESTQWHYLDSINTTCKTRHLTALGTFQNKYVNFAKIKYGKGNFYFHNNPILFTNYFLLDSNHLRYTSKVFGHLTQGTIYWDPTSRLPDNAGRQMNDPFDKHRQFDKKSPLQYILSQQALAWAWYLFLAGIFLYMIFTAKRMQRLIPVLPLKTNDSLAFIKTVGRLYFVQNDSVKLCSEMLRYFQIFVREKYRISEQLFIKNAPAQAALIAKSGIDAQIVQTILGFERRIDNRNIVESDAIELYGLLKIFYKNCK